jgi:hypothetical protein
VQGVASLERREANLVVRHDMLQKLNTDSSSNEIQSNPITSEVVSNTAHYHIGSRGTIVRFVDFFHTHKDDPAAKVSIIYRFIG